MRRRLILGGWFAFPLLPIGIYALRLDSFANLYFLSVALGLGAFTYVCSLFLLAAPPRILARALSPEVRTYLASRLPIIILVLGLAHRVLKIGLLPPFSKASGQAPLGVTLLQGLAFYPGSLSSILGSLGYLGLGLGFLAGALVLVPKFRASRLGQGFTTRLASLLARQGKKELAVYGVLGILSAVFLCHVLAASSTSFFSNPLGASFLCLEFGACLWCYVVAKIRGLPQISKLSSTS